MNENIHGSLAEILEVKRLILAVTFTPVIKDFSFLIQSYSIIKIEGEKGRRRGKGRKEEGKKEMI